MWETFPFIDVKSSSTTHGDRRGVVMPIARFVLRTLASRVGADAGRAATQSTGTVAGSESKCRMPLALLYEPASVGQLLRHGEKSCRTLEFERLRKH